MWSWKGAGCCLYDLDGIGRMNAKKVQISCVNLHAVYVLPSYRFYIFSSQKRVLHVSALQPMLI
jgi:hypothetical protein